MPTSAAAPSPGDDTSAEVLRVARIPGKGRGVIAGRRIARGELVDTVPVVVIPGREWAALQQTVLVRFCFGWDEDTGSTALALGRPSLFNHSYTPNVAAAKLLGARRMEFSARRDIEPGEELTLNYHGDTARRDPLGFTVKE